VFRMTDCFASAWTLLAFLVLTGTASAESLPRNPRDILGRALDPYQAGCPHLVVGVVLHTMHQTITKHM